MSAKNVNNEKTESAAAPRRPNKFMVALLILTSISGYALCAALFFVGTQTDFLSSTEKLAPLTQTLNEKASTLLQNTIPTARKETAINFQGTLRSEKGMIALVNDEMVALGATIDGIRIVDITERALTVEYGEETTTIPFGESVSITH